MSEAISEHSAKKTTAFRLVLSAEFAEMLRARWYQAYFLLFGALIFVFFNFGLSESSVLGFAGLSRILLTFIQITIVIVPIFALIITVRTMVTDREMGVWEYILSWPMDMKAYYWGKTVGRMVAIAMPLALALVLSGLSQEVIGNDVEWAHIFWMMGYVSSLVICFVGIALFVSVVAKSQEVALGLAFAIWLSCEALIDSLVLGLLVRNQLTPESVISIALLNPIQAFRTASIGVFDVQFSILGPISHTILDIFGRTTVLWWSLLWPFVLGMSFAVAGAFVLLRKDLTA